MTTRPIIHAVVPVKDTRQAKQRLAGVLDRAQRQELALAMLEDVLEALAKASAVASTWRASASRSSSVVIKVCATLTAMPSAAVSVTAPASARSST